MQELEYKGYQGTIEISLEDNDLYGIVKSYNNKPIKSLILYDGKTPKRLYKCFKEMVDDYIKYYKL